MWLGVAAAAAMVIGSFGPWGRAIGIVNVDINGTDGSNDGWFVVLSAVLGAGALIFWYFRRRRVGALGTLLAGAAGTAIAIYDRQNVSDINRANTSSLVTFQVGWGLNLALGASLVLGVVGLIALLGNPEAPGMRPAEPAQAPLGSQQPVPAPPPGMLAEELERLGELRGRGLLDEDEFKRAKERLLTEQRSDAPPATSPE